MSRTARSLKTNIIAGIVALLIAVPGGAFLLTRSDNHQAQNTPAANQEVLSDRSEESQDHGHGEATVTADYVSYKGVHEHTALELLKSRADVQTKTSEFGEFVTSINGNDGGGTKYWMFYADGKEASVGAGAYYTRDGENIEWKLQ